MAVPLVTFIGQRLHDMGDTDGTTGVGSTGGGGAGAGSEPDFVYQGSNSVSRKVGTTAAGFDVDTGAFGTPRNANMRDPRNQDEGIWFVKVIATNKDALLDLGAPSMELRLGDSGGTNYVTIQLTGADFYPIKGGWILTGLSASNGTSSTHLDELGVITGTMTLAPDQADYFGVAADFGSTSKSENLAMDAIDVGMGLSISGGTSTDPQATFDDAVSFDQGTSSNRYGAITETDGIMSAIGMLMFGSNEFAEITPISTDFDDSFFTIVWPRAWTGRYTGMRFNMGGTSQVYNMEDGSILGQTPRQDILFNTETDVDGTGDIIELTDDDLQARWSKGTAVNARDLEGTETPGITDGGQYYVGWDSASTGITLHTTRLLALQDGTAVNLTASSAGNGEVWALTAANPYRSKPRITFDDTDAGSSATFTRMFFSNLGQFDNEDADPDIEFIDCTFISMTGHADNSGENANNVVFSGCQFLGQDTWAKINSSATSGAKPSSLLPHNDIGDISDCLFDFGDALGGHAIRQTATGTFSFSGNTFTGFATGDQDTHEFDNTDDVNATTDRITLLTGHGYVTGDPVVYDRRLTANTGLTGLTEDNTYFVNVSTNDVSLHLNQGDAINDNATIALTVGTGNETHALWPANAAIFNDSGGLVTINVSDGSTPTIRNALDSTTVINNNVAVTFSGMRDNTEVRVYAAGTKTELDGIENATAGTPDNRTFVASVAGATSVDYVLHNTQYEYIRVEGFTWPATATIIEVQQRFDRNYDNP